MSLWYLADLARLARERAEVDRLASEAGWFVAAEWSIGLGNLLTLEATIRAHGFDYHLRLIYPQMFPFVPPAVYPAEPDTRWSNHQYGQGGPLCLEWRPDNWQPEITGAQMLESAYRLLETENPLGRPEGQAGGVVPSAHRLSFGQEIRGAGHWMRVFVPLDCAAFLAALPRPIVGEVKVVYRRHVGGFVVLIRSIRVGEREWLAALPPDEALGVAADTGNIVSTDLSAQELAALGNVANLTGVFAPSDVSVDWLLVVGPDLAPHLFFKAADGVLLPATVVTDDAALAERTPPQYSGLASRRIAIIGLGSLGTKMAVSLARMGVVDFLLADDDIVFPGNLVRNALDWTAVASHKVDAAAEAILRIQANARVDQYRMRLTGQESSAEIAALVAKIGECDIIVDVTASAANFNVAAGAAVARKKPLVAAEVYGGGKGGVILRSIPDVDPPPHVVRLAYLRFCEENPAPDAPAIDYGLVAGDGPVLTASDADVSVIADHAVRVVADALVNTVPDHAFPIYLVGLSRWWVFSAPFDTRPLAVPRDQWPATPASSDEETQKGVKFLCRLIEKRSDAPASS